MIEMHPCPSCTELVVEGTCLCPHCGEKACRRSGVHGAAVLLGLSLVVGCGGTPNPDYTGTVTSTGVGGANRAVPEAPASVEPSREEEKEEGEKAELEDPGAGD